MKIIILMIYISIFIEISLSYILRKRILNIYKIIAINNPNILNNILVHYKYANIILFMDGVISVLLLFDTHSNNIIYIISIVVMLAIIVYFYFEYINIILNKYFKN